MTDPWYRLIAYLLDSRSDGLWYPELSTGETRRLRPRATRQMGHSLAVLLATYAHLIDEYAELERVDANAEIIAARENNVRQEFGRSR